MFSDAWAMLTSWLWSVIFFPFAREGQLGLPEGEAVL